MGVLPDWMIQSDIKIEPFAENASRQGVISYGVTSYGYDVRVGRKFKVFTNARCVVVDPKNFDPASFVDVEADHCFIPPNSFALAETVEHLTIPRDIIAVKNRRIGRSRRSITHEYTRPMLIRFFHRIAISGRPCGASVKGVRLLARG